MDFSALLLNAPDGVVVHRLIIWPDDQGQGRIGPINCKKILVTKFYNSLQFTLHLKVTGVICS